MRLEAQRLFHSIKRAVCAGGVQGGRGDCTAQSSLISLSFFPPTHPHLYTFLPLPPDTLPVRPVSPPLTLPPSISIHISVSAEAALARLPRAKYKPCCSDAGKNASITTATCDIRQGGQNGTGKPR